MVAVAVTWAATVPTMAKDHSSQDAFSRLSEAVLEQAGDGLDVVLLPHLLNTPGVAGEDKHAQHIGRAVAMAMEPWCRRCPPVPSCAASDNGGTHGGGQDHRPQCASRYIIVIRVLMRLTNHTPTSSMKSRYSPIMTRSRVVTSTITGLLCLSSDPGRSGPAGSFPSFLGIFVKIITQIRRHGNKNHKSRVLGVPLKSQAPPFFLTPAGEKPIIPLNYLTS